MLAIKEIAIWRNKNNLLTEELDKLAVEEPLEISIEYGPENGRRIKNISITMRTPGDDKELASGFLFTEGIIKSTQEIIKIQQSLNAITLILHPNKAINIEKLERHFYTSSSCGVCGKSSIDAIKTTTDSCYNSSNFNITSATFFGLNDTLKTQQNIFNTTGGLHASALFDINGNFIELKEDVGRHNALDKLIGSMLSKSNVPLKDKLLLLSGRTSFELIQKAAMASIPVVAAVGAPSSLAVELANEFNITLIGFLRNDRYNIYSGGHRINQSVVSI